MEAYLDYQKGGSGGKLNDIIEDFKYVYKGQSVKAGDFLTYIEGTASEGVTEIQVTPATESPFNAIALSSGEGSPEYVEAEVTKTDNIFPHTAEAWTEVTYGTKYSSADGYIIEASTADGSNGAYKAFIHGSEYGSWDSLRKVSSWLQITCPEAKKITKMKLNWGDACNRNTEEATFYIRGSKDGTKWTNLYTTTEEDPYDDLERLTEVVLNNTDYYSYYRIYVSYSSLYSISVYDWQVSEYVEKGLVPSTAHKDQVKIAIPNAQEVIT